MSSFSNINAFADPEDSALVTGAKKEVPEPVVYNYTERDVILYNLGIGATAEELQWTFESNSEFGVLPTFGVIPQFAAAAVLSLDWLPNFNPVGKSLHIKARSDMDFRLQAKLLHGEHYLAIKAPIPTSGEFVNYARSVTRVQCPFNPQLRTQLLFRILEVLDKGKAASVTTIIETREKTKGQLIFENQSTVFIRGSGGFGGRRTGKSASLLPFNKFNFLIAALHIRPRSSYGIQYTSQSSSGCSRRRGNLTIASCTLSVRSWFDTLLCPHNSRRLSGDYNPLHVSVN
jgi:hypothetical protein